MSSIPDRVREMIQESGLSQREFGLHIGLDDSKLSKSLRGTRRFSSVDLARIAELCNVTVDWLVTGDDTQIAVAARTTGGTAGTALEIAKRYGTLRTDMASLGYTQPWSGSSNLSEAGSFQAQGTRLAKAATKRLAVKGSSVLQPDLASAIESAFGVDVAVVALDQDFDGLAVSYPDVKLIILAASTIPARQRFTLAHELGHLLAGDDQGVHLDEDVFGKAQKRDGSELRANSFAAAFLMPEEILRERLIPAKFSEESFAGLAFDLMVTPSALAFRLLDLHLIDAGLCDRFKRLTAAKAANLVGRGVAFGERVVAASTPRAPGLLVRDTYAAYDSGAATLRPYANLLDIDVEQLRESLESDRGA